MKNASAGIGLGLMVFLGFSGVAVALDSTVAVMMTPLLKTTTRWNGQPLAYPPGSAEITRLHARE